MARRVEFPEGAVSLDGHASVAHLAGSVRDLRQEAGRVLPRLEGRTVWMVNSTEHGGGVAEMLPTMVRLLRDLGIATEWLVIESEDEAFFDLTKRIHNLMHGVGEPTLTEADRELYERVNRRNADQIGEWVDDGDVLVVHDPQPLPLARMLAGKRRLQTVWRCHIGLDDRNEATDAAWRFIEPYAEVYEAAVFSAPEYIPRFLVGRARIIHPAIDPLTPKNTHLGLHQTIQILSNASLVVPPGPLVTPEWEHRAQRLQPDRHFATATSPEDIGLLTRPIVTQVSRWDRLKGFLPLMLGFAELKERVRSDAPASSQDGTRARRLDLARLVLAGPDPESVADDPEGQAVLGELCDAYAEFPEHAQRDIAVVTLPMAVPTENALMVNALHRVSTLVVQNSLREGFGLTITEAMWKGVPVLSNARACGPRHQVRDGIDGRLVADPEDVGALATVMIEMLGDEAQLGRWARNAQRHAHERFLIFGQLAAWIELLWEVT
jgi:trehalose synthase